MARSDGITATIRSTGVTDQELIDRLKDLRPAYRALKPLLTTASSYERDDRFRGGIGRPDKDGVARNWGPGYGPHVRTRATKQKGGTTSSRGFMPILKADADDQVAETLTTYILTGRASRLNVTSRGDE